MFEGLKLKNKVRFFVSNLRGRGGVLSYQDFLRPSESIGFLAPFLFCEIFRHTPLKIPQNQAELPLICDIIAKRYIDMAKPKRR